MVKTDDEEEQICPVILFTLLYLDLFQCYYVVFKKISTVVWFKLQ